MRKNSANYSENKNIFINEFKLDLLGIGTLVSGLASMGASIYNTNAQKEMNSNNISAQESINKANIESQERINKANIESQEKINQENLDYARSMTQAQWERDDNAYQRQVADLQSVGLSPLLATGAGTTPAQVYQGESARQESAMQYPGHYQAPQFDVNSLVQSISQLEQLQETRRHNKAVEGVQQGTLQTRIEQNQIKLSQMEQSENQFTRKLAESARQFDNNFQYLNEVFENSKSEHNREYNLRTVEVATENTYKSMLSQLPDNARNLPRAYSSDLAEVEQNNTYYYDQFNRYLSMVEDGTIKLPKRSSSHGSNHGDSAGQGISALSVSSSASRSQHSGEYESESISTTEEFLSSWSAYAMKNQIKFYIYVRK